MHRVAMSVKGPETLICYNLFAEVSHLQRAGTLNCGKGFLLFVKVCVLLLSEKNKRQNAEILRSFSAKAHTFAGK